MRRYLLVVFLLGIQFITKAAVITWVGASGGNWNTASNWAPAAVPTLSDDVVFNTSVTVNMDVLSAITYSINSLLITSNSTVNLQRTQAGGGTRILQVVSTSNITKGLQIDAGSTLVINGINTNTTGTLDYILDMGGATGVTGEISGELHFTGVGSSSTSAGTRLRIWTDASNNANLVVKNGGIIRYLPLSGNTSSSATGTFLTMESGSQYIIEKNGGSFPSGGSWDPNSLAKVENITGSNGPTFNGNAYGNLEWNCPSQSAVSFFSSDISFNNVDLISTNNIGFRIRTGASAGVYTMTVNGDLNIGSTSVLEITGNTVTAGNGGRINLKGSLNNQGTLTTGGLSGTINDFELNGTSNQILISSGIFSGPRLVFIMNNSFGATLNSPLTLQYNLSLSSGKITTSATNLLTMADNATYTGGSATSFIDGTMKKIGDDNFIFPVGKGSIYAPIGVSGSGGAISDEFTAEYLRTNPQSIHGACPAACAGGLDHVSYVEYWKLNQDVGTSAKQVSLEVHALSFCKMLANTFVSRWNGAQWTNETTAILAGPNACGSGLECGTIQASNTTTAFGDFTLATDQPFLNNPLPVTLVDFKVKKYSEQAAVAEWELTDYCFTATQFELEHSTDNTSFAVIAVQPGKENSRFYFYNDTRIEKGTNWYRLKITEVDGTITYSKVIAIINDTKGLLITSVFPNPASNTATITLSAARSGMADIQLYDISGTVVYRRRSAIAEGTNNLPIELGKLSAGVYHLAVQSADSKAVYRLVKQ